MEFQSEAQWRQEQRQRAQLRQKLLSEPEAQRARRYAPAATTAAAAERLFAALEDARLVDPVWQAQQGRRFYLRLSRFYQAALSKTPTAANDRLWRSHLARCYYQTQQFSRWEDEQRRLGQVPARAIEKALRWNGQADDGSGSGYEIVSAYRAEMMRREPRAGKDESKIATPLDAGGTAG